MWHLITSCGALVDCIAICTSLDGACLRETAESRLEQQLTFLTRTCVRYEVHDYYGTGPPPRTPEERTAAEYLLRTRRCALTIDGSRIRFQEQVVGGRSDVQLLVGREQLLVFDGFRTTRRVWLSGEAESSVDVRDGYDPLFRRLPALSWLGWWAFQMPERTDLLELFRACRVSDAEATAFETRIALVGATLRIQVDAEGRLSEAQFLVDPHSAQDHARYAESRLSMSYDSHALIPDGATVFVWHHRDDPEHEFWGVSRIKLLGHEPGEIGDIGPVSIGTLVRDHRYMIGYSVGSQAVTIDGRLLLTASPLPWDLGDQMEQFIDQAVWADVAVEPSIARINPPGERIHSILGLAVLGVGVSILVGSRYRRRI